MTRVALILVGCLILFGVLVGVLSFTSQGRTDFLIVQVILFFVVFLLGLLLWDISWRLTRRLSGPK